MESSRARLLLAMLAERDLVLAPDAPGDLDRERATLSRETDRLQGQLREPGRHRNPPRSRGCRSDSWRCGSASSSSALELTRQAPRLAALRYPQPLDAAGVRRSLDPGTVLVAFSTGRERSVVFVVTRDGVSATPLALGVADLADQVRAFRNLLQRAPGTRLRGHPARACAAPVRPGCCARSRATSRQPAVWCSCRTVRSTCFPSERWCRSSGRRRLTSVPCRVEAPQRHPLRHAAGRAGPPPPRGGGQRDGPVPSWRSGTRWSPGRRATARGTQPARQALLDTLRREGMDLGPLPATRREVASLGRMWGDRATVLVGEAATEDQVMALGRRPRFVHFACHGLVDERSPLDSSLILSPPSPGAGDAQGNGILQAWEVFEGVRLDAELVVLSACDTALGRELDGEGLIGLTRAFQYAGARAVVASLWSVADDSTAALMTNDVRGPARRPAEGPGASGRPAGPAAPQGADRRARRRDGGDGRLQPVLLGRLPALRRWSLTRKEPARQKARRRATSQEG